MDCIPNKNKNVCTIYPGKLRLGYFFGVGELNTQTTMNALKEGKIMGEEVNKIHVCGTK